MNALNFIDGRPCPALGAKTLENVEPASGRPLGTVAASDARDVDAAVQAAQRAFPAWSSLPASRRGRHLRDLARLIERDLERLARAESVDAGKPITAARTLDIPRAMANFDFFADAATQFPSESHANEGALNYTLRAPLGAVACISPWNLPLYLLTWKIAPALAAGNTVVAKPSEVTPLTAHLLGLLCAEAGLPPGVLNLVQGTGPDAGAPLVAHPGIKAVSFTGSTKVGQEIAVSCAKRFTKVSLELGGKNALLVFADADLDEAATLAVRAAFSNQGQICLCGSRILVHESVRAAFTERLVAKTRALRMGDPLEPETEQGALVSRAHLEKVLGCLEVAKAEGARILCGGKRARVEERCAEGFFVEPTLIEGLGPEARTNQDEIFGPVATILPFQSDDEAVRLANSTRYGLAASVLTRDLNRAHTVAQKLAVGIVWVNCWLLRDLRTPFGGVKDSGVGREGGFEAMRFFTESKNVCVKL